MKKGIDNSGKTRYNIFVRFDKYGRMAQLVVPTGTFSRMRDVDVNRLLASRSLESTEGSPKNPNILGEIVRIVRIRSHGSVGSPFCTDYINSTLPSPRKIPLTDGMCRLHKNR